MTTSEKLGLCDFVYAVDVGTVDPVNEAGDEAFAIRRTFRDTVNGRLLQGVICTTADCPSGAVIDVERQAIDDATYEYACGESCVRRPELNAEDPRLPQITSANGCLAAGTAFALQRFGFTLQPEVFDSWMHREEGRSPDHAGMRALRLKLLGGGYAIETILPRGMIPSGDFFQPDSPYTYDDFVRQSLRLDPREMNRQWLSEVFTEQAFEQWVEQGRLLDAEFKPYRDSGQLKVTPADITVDMIAKRLESEALQCNILSQDGSKSTTHNVVVTGIRQTKSGGVVVTYFNPGSQAEDTYYPSIIAEVRKPSLSDAIILYDGLDFIKPFDAQGTDAEPTQV